MTYYYRCSACGDVMPDDEVGDHVENFSDTHDTGVLRLQRVTPDGKPVDGWPTPPTDADAGADDDTDADADADDAATGGGGQ